jgi:hypothetical protein
MLISSESIFRNRTLIYVDSVTQIPADTAFFFGITIAKTTSLLKGDLLHFQQHTKRITLGRK